ncbi:DUF3105 domain-containing protein [Rhodococcus sp. ABRD24]|uniref:DUF3105 domain-containing protein n=1 Tax=Rhodococcus sp. ABRD24 TaxID=2507582 RepID=UPI001039E836|nr:DUF3105 domain-containing protein [Rhodococcus sp. ABRD24]QBJ96342.1 DUF3105 domain-containing protein [Rhodococcus sp. ABRD24]
MTDNRKKTKSGGIPGTRRIPWQLIGAVTVVLGLVAVIAYNTVPRALEQAEAQRYAPSSDNPDPSTDIAGVVEAEYPAGNHVQAPQQVAYDKTPPFGGAHDQYWATCTGVVYPEPIRSENAVHSLEHGAVWLTYNPDRISSDDIGALAAKVDGEPYSLMSPYPDLDTTISLQSWGRQLKLDDARDERIGQFITALRQNPNTHPEAGASCSTLRGGFDPDNPPPFAPPASGPDSVPVAEAPAEPQGRPTAVPPGDGNG